MKSLAGVIVFAFLATLGCKGKSHEKGAKGAKRAKAPAHDAAPKTPDAGPYDRLGLAPGTVEANPGDSVWAAAEKKGEWDLGLFEVVEAKGSAWKVSGRDQRQAPAAFIAAPTDTAPAEGARVIYTTDRVEFGIVAGVQGDKVVVHHFTLGGGLLKTAMPVGAVREVPMGVFALGSPVAFEEEGMWHQGVIAGQSEDRVHVIRGVGKGSSLVSIPKPSVQLIDGSDAISVGMEVWHRPNNQWPGDSTLKAGKVRGKLKDIGYAIELEGGRQDSVPWGHLVPK